MTVKSKPIKYLQYTKHSWQESITKIHIQNRADWIRLLWIDLTLKYEFLYDLKAKLKPDTNKFYL